MTAILTVLLLALNAGDWWTTRRFLAHGYRETNPLMRAVLERFGLHGLALVKLAAAGSIAWACIAFGLWPLLVLLDLFFAWVCWHNWRLVR
jgi:hypothetical protein